MVDISKLTTAQLDGLVFWLGNYGPVNLSIEDKLELWLTDQINQQAKIVIMNTVGELYSHPSGKPVIDKAIDEAKMEVAKG